MDSRYVFATEAESRSQRNIEFPMGVKIERHCVAEYEQNLSASDKESKEDKLIRMMQSVLNGQNTHLLRLDNLETDVAGLKKNLSDMGKNNEQLKFVQYKTAQQMEKMNAELFKIAARTGSIKDLAVSTAAHTLNTARKIHGAKSSLDPVKQFKDGGYRDLSIRPEIIEEQSFNMPVQMGMVNNGYQSNAYAQQGNRTPAYAPNYPELDRNQGSRTPAYGSRTPVYDGSRTPVYDRSETEDIWHSNGNKHKYSSNKNKSVGKYEGRYEPYQKQDNLNNTFPRSKLADLPYEPASPTYD